MNEMKDRGAEEALERYRREIAALKVKNRELYEKVREYKRIEEDYRRVLGSYSWRLTRPFRLNSIARRLFSLAASSSILAPLVDRIYPLIAWAKSSAMRRGVPLTQLGEKRRSRVYIATPLPPLPTGVADYVVGLIEPLGEFYEVVFIVSQERVEGLEGRGSVVSSEWYLEHGRLEDQLILHVGNSPFHAWMIPLLEKFGGVVVLHDFYLDGLFNSMRRYFDELTYSHGYKSLEAFRLLDEPQQRRAFPVNRRIFEYADRVVLHSEHAMELAREWYGERYDEKLFFVPFPRALPERLKQSSELFYVCCFGFLGFDKLCDVIIKAWNESEIATMDRARLVFVGGFAQESYRGRIDSLLLESPMADKIIITGFVEKATYQAWLERAGVAIQLRAHSRGESSKTALDALAYGIPLIVSEVGAMAELPDDVATKVRVDIEPKALGAVISRVFKEALEGRYLTQGARDYVERHHQPRESALAYQRVLESLSASRARGGVRTIFVDVSDLAERDLRTGIQRVVKNILKQFFALEALEAFHIEPVRAKGSGYVRATDFTLSLLDLPFEEIEESPVDMRAGDMFFGLDLLPHKISIMRPFFEGLSKRGVEIAFIVHDLLPVRTPHFFPPQSEFFFRKWLETITSVADRLLCVSRATACDLERWILENPTPNRSSPLKIAHFHLGADMQGASGVKKERKDRGCWRGKITFLMVGTIEPRKGHEAVLEAFELLWGEGLEVNLVIVGKAGWMVDGLMERIKNHAQQNRNLFWLGACSDEVLEGLYRSSDALIAASQGEGFGLPLIEAAYYEIPIVARNIPVFREVAGEHAYYFDASSSRELADSLKGWLRLRGEGAIPLSVTMPYLTWEESAKWLARELLS